MERERAVMIIVMQGYPCTGKTTVAKDLAQTLQCPLIHLDHILYVLSPSNPLPDTYEALFSQAFDLITPIIKTHVSQGFSVIIDPPFSRCSHLDKLVAISKEMQQNSSKVAPSLIIIECIPKIEYVWEIRFLERQDNGNDMKWWNPEEWSDVWQQYITGDYSTADETDLTPWGSKLIVDFTDLIRSDLLAEAVRDLAKSTGLKVELKEWMLIHYEGPLLHLIDQKRQHEEETKGGHSSNSSSSSRKGFCTDGHCVNVFMEDGISHYAICGVCGERVLTNSSPAYTCRFCSLAIHKTCAELLEQVSFTPENFPKFLKRDPPHDLAKLMSYCFPEKHLCLRCRLQGNVFSYDCASCIFHSHLKCRLIPTIIHHTGHEHNLFFWARSIFIANKQYLCAACRRPGECVAYGCIEGCGINYHPECALLAPFRRHSHGGHDHHMDLIFSLNEVAVDYFCVVCLEPMNPKAWYYNCGVCELSAHLPCIHCDEYTELSSEQIKELAKINKL